MRLVALLILIQSCALFKGKDLSDQLDESLKNVCLSSQGKGRLQVGNSKYVFSYEAALDEEHANWLLALNFPLRPQETLQLDWSQEGGTKLKTSLEDKIIKELNAAQGAPVNIDGYYYPDYNKVSKAMRPSETLNAILN